MSKKSGKHKFNTAPATGMRDLFPASSDAFYQVETICRDVALLYGYGEIRTPCLESTALFVRGLGDVTDIVEKEMFSLTTSGGDQLSLRPENTASVVRAYVNSGLHRRKGFVKLFYLGPMFRHEKPQRYRYRQFTQFGVEALYVNTPESDVEVIAMGYEIYRRLEIPDVTVSLYTFGDAASRVPWRDALVDYFTANRDALSDDSRRRLDRNVFRILDSKQPEDIALCDHAPLLENFLTDSARAHFDTVKRGLDALNIPYTLNPRLVRGLDYYTHTIFEFYGAEQGRQSALGAGGRYDGLIEEFGGPANAGAVGFALGVDRMVAVRVGNELYDSGVSWSPPVRVAYQEPPARIGAMALAEMLRAAGIACEVDLEGRSFKKQLLRAGKDGCRVVVIAGEAELKDGRAWVKDFSSGRQKVFPVDGLADTVRSILNGEYTIPPAME